MLKDIKNINNWDKSKKRKFFWTFTILWTLFVWLIDGEWLYFIPFVVGDVIFWKTFNFTFWKKRKKEEKCEDPKFTFSLFHSSFWSGGGDRLTPPTQNAELLP